MDAFMLLLLALMAFMIIGSLIAAETEDLLSAVICVGAVGAGLAILDLFLGAPDLAITQVAVEVLSVAILIRVVLTRRDETHETHKDTLAIGSVLLVLGVLFVLGGWAMTRLHPFGQPLFASNGLKRRPRVRAASRRVPDRGHGSGTRRTGSGSACRR